ncbi:T3SS effector HopA1 family protein [Nocardia asiatica]|uniref:T3SS effector HopA1 family protein n=1 Tax=Nocardia asiatica TaxID=209252 RepID=UPI003EE41052
MSTEEGKSPRIADDLLHAARMVEVIERETLDEAVGDMGSAMDTWTARARLSERIYRILHSGSAENIAGELPRSSRDPRFERVLAHHSPRQSIPIRVKVRGLPQLRSDGPSRVLVEHDGIRVWIPETWVDHDCFAIGDEIDVRVSRIRPALSPGFFFLVENKPILGCTELRIYIHLVSAEVAPPIWYCVLELLEGYRATYRAKILSRPWLYPRRDALVVYLAAGCSRLAMEIVDLVNPLEGIGEETSVFTQRLGRGVALGWEPNDPRPEMRRLSFGQHRATALADGLIDRHRGNDGIEVCLDRALRVAGINPSNPAENLSGGRLP